jgi:hypothetical protein
MHIGSEQSHASAALLCVFGGSRTCVNQRSIMIKFREILLVQIGGVSPSAGRPEHGAAITHAKWAHLMLYIHNAEMTNNKFRPYTCPSAYSHKNIQI